MNGPYTGAAHACRIPADAGAGSPVETLVALARSAERYFPELDAARERYDAAVQRMR